MTSHDLRQAYLTFFASRAHTVVPSASLIPHGDPTLLFTNSGMVPFKDVFLGRESRPYSRAVSVQKCVRAGGKHNDLDEVGRTARHHTFFEMLGNWSFGDYFKEEAIALAWEFVTKELGLPKDRLYFSVYQDDEEAAAIWRKVAGVADSRIARLGERQNFWQMADTGPCGPDSEIFYDRGERYSDRPFYSEEGERYIEVWNLVFMQYDRSPDGVLSPLPMRHVDTGMGLERATSILEGVATNWDTDLFRPLLLAIADLAHRGYAWETGLPMRVIADHARAAAFLIADGVLPSNEKRGYVLRRLLRRAVLKGRDIGLAGPFLGRLLPVLQESMAKAYPELIERASLILGVMEAEEEHFSRTLEEGSRLLASRLGEVPAGGVLPSGVAFVLSDTYGFPLELTAEVAEASGRGVDREGYGRLLEARRAESRAGRHVDGSLLADAQGLAQGLPPTRFTGYEGVTGEGRILLLLRDGEVADEGREGDHVALITDATPFYGEGGGQVGDSGTVKGPHGVVEVSDTKRLGGERLLHIGRVTRGWVLPDEGVTLSVDARRRAATMRNHTATHLLHHALRQRLGDHVHQAGSVVEPSRLRFDFTHFAPLTPKDVAAVEDEVMRLIMDDRPVTWRRMPLAEARRSGAMALFEEKYGDIVRVVSVEGCSDELCGGTHVGRTGEIGGFRIIQETSVASGVRRIVAVTGDAVLARLREKEDTLARTSAALKVPEEELPARAEDLRRRVSELEAAVVQARAAAVAGLFDEALGTPSPGGRVTALSPEGMSLEELRRLSDLWRGKERRGILALSSVREGRTNLLVAVTKDLVHEGISAQDIFAPMAEVAGGKGGGRGDLVQGSAAGTSAARPAVEAARKAALAALERVEGAKGGVAHE